MLRHQLSPMLGPGIDALNNVTVAAPSSVAPTKQVQNFIVHMQGMAMDVVVAGLQMVPPACNGPHSQQIRS